MSDYIKKSTANFPLERKFGFTNDGFWTINEGEAEGQYLGKGVFRKRFNKS